MSNTNTKIEWTDTTWNVVTGCTKVSAGCANCYAERLAPRVFAGQYVDVDGSVLDQPELGDAGFRPRRFTDVRCHEDRLDAPLRWRKPRRVFVASMSDPFHDAVPAGFIDRMMAVIALCPHHSFQLLTKRPKRMRDYLSDPQTPFRVQRAMDAIAVDQEMRGQRERWAAIPGFPDYSVSSLGRVRSSLGHDAKILAQADHSGGYKQVGLRRGGHTNTRLVHALVLEAFVRARREGDEACHRNGDRTDNRIANLSWGTKASNMRDAARHGTAGVWMKGRARLSAEVVEDIRIRRQAGALLSTLAVLYDITEQQVSAIARGKIYKAAELEWPMSQLWLGVSVEDQATADERIPILLDTPAAVRFVSAEPLLGAVDIRRPMCSTAEFAEALERARDDGYVTQGEAQTAVEKHYRERGGRSTLDWIIVGGESGPKARPCDVAWIRSIVEQCKAAGVPPFCKQFGAHVLDRLDAIEDRWPPGTETEFVDWRDGDADRRYQGANVRVLLRDRKGGDPSEWPEDSRVREWPQTCEVTA